MARTFWIGSIVVVLGSCVTSLVNGEEPAQTPPGETVARGLSAREESILEQMREPITWSAKEKPLREIVDELRQQWHINIVVDDAALTAAAIDASAVVISADLRDIPRGRFLDVVFTPLAMAWTVHHDVLWITTAEVASKHLVTRLYDVSDLFEWHEVADFDSLIDMIQSVVDPSIWDDVGGEGSIEPFEGKGIRALAVRQTREFHEIIERLLDDLRKLRHEGARLPPSFTPAPMPPKGGLQHTPGSFGPSVDPAHSDS